MYNYVAIASYSKLAIVATNQFLIMCVGCAAAPWPCDMEFTQNFD